MTARPERDQGGDPTHKVTLSLYVTDEAEAERFMNWIADGKEPFDRDSLVFAGLHVEPVEGPFYDQTAS